MTGKDGADGKDGKDGADGLNGKNGLTPEIDPKTGEWIIVNKETRDTIFTHIAAKGRDGKDGVDGKDGADGKDGKDGIDGKDGADGRDGDTPYVGSNGNWWIGSVDTGVKAQGPKGDTGADGKDGVNGKDGKDGVDGKNGADGKDGKDGVDGKDGADGKDGKDGVDGKDGADGKDGKDGADGSAGKSAYELWVTDVQSPSGLEDPKNPGTKWDPSKTSIADFYEYLSGASGANGKDGTDGRDGIDGKDGSDGKDGADGKDGTDGKDGSDGANGKSAYDLWKELVLSEEGLDNPGNGVYDIDMYPKWPRTAVSIYDFFKYLRGSDGESGTMMSVVDTLYVEEVDWSKYNVAPVRSLAKVNSTGEKKDTTYEYVNPYSGGCALIVSGPGPVAIPNCKVEFKDQTGNSFSKTSDSRGYIYLTRNELPDWRSGSPSMSDLSARTKPTSFSFGGKTITDAGKIAATCGVPYKVDVSVRMTGSSWEKTTVTADYEITRIVEGQSEKEWGGVKFPESKDGAGYFMYRSLGDINRFRKVEFARIGISPNDFIYGDHFMKIDNTGVKNSWKRSLGTVESTVTEALTYGDGGSPLVVDVNYMPTKKGYGELIYYREPSPDYGLQAKSSTKTIIPEYCSVGDLNIEGLKGGTDDEQFTSYNGKLVLSDDGTTKVPVNMTNYELILGQTSFTFAFDYSTFGHVYLRDGYYDASTDTFRFKRYGTLLSYLEDLKQTKDVEYVTVFSNSGQLGGVNINNNVPICFSVKNGVIQKAKKEPFTIRNVYDKFSITIGTFLFDDVYYGEVKGRFVYDESNPYVASCELGDKKYVFQAIKDAVSAPLP